MFLSGLSAHEPVQFDKSLQSIWHGTDEHEHSDIGQRVGHIDDLIGQVETIPKEGFEAAEHCHQNNGGDDETDRGIPDLFSSGPFAGTYNPSAQREQVADLKYTQGKNEQK